MGGVHPVIRQLQAARKERGWSQHKVASQIYRNQVTISRWESGLRFPDINDLHDWAAVFGYDITITTTKEK